MSGSGRAAGARRRWRSRRLGRVAAAGVLAIAGGGCATGGEGASGRPEALPVEVLAERHGDAVWRVETEGCGWIGVGSAFLVDERRLVTNHHVIANDPTPQVRSRRGEVRDGRVIGADRSLDIAVIELADPAGEALAWAPSRSLELTERLVMLGYPRPEHAFTVSYGSLLRSAGAEQAAEVLLSDAPVERGSSGGPALRGDGTVAGVVTRAVLDDPGQHVTIVYPADRVVTAVAEAIAAPGDPGTDCEIGPDYAPPAPPELEIDAPPPPPEPPIVPPVPPPSAVPTTGAVPETVPSRPLPTWEAPIVPVPDPPPCPVGSMTVTSEITSVVAEGDQQRIVAQGTVTSGAAHVIAVEGVEVRFSGPAPTTVVVALEPALLGPGGVGAWRAEVLVPPVDGPPMPPQVRVLARWAGDAAACPAPSQSPS